MNTELAAVLRPLVLPEGVERMSESILPGVTDLLPELAAALAIAGRDSAAIVACDCGEGFRGVFVGARMTIRDQLATLGYVAAATAPRLDVRAPRGTWFVVVVDTEDRATVALASAPGSELAPRGQA